MALIKFQLFDNGTLACISLLVERRADIRSPRLTLVMLMRPDNKVRNPPHPTPASLQPAPMQARAKSSDLAAEPGEADTLRLDLEFDFSSFRFRRILFNAKSDPERAASLKTRLFGSIMARNARQWVRNYIHANIDIEAAGNPVQHILSQRQVNSRDFFKMVMQTRRRGLNLDLGEATIHGEPSFFDPTLRAFGFPQKPEEVELSRSRFFLRAISAPRMFDLFTSSTAQKLVDAISDTDDALKDPSLVNQLREFKNAAQGWREDRISHGDDVTEDFDFALNQLNMLIHAIDVCTGQAHDGKIFFNGDGASFLWVTDQFVSHEPLAGPTRAHMMEKKSVTFDGIFDAIRAHCDKLTKKLGHPPLLATLLDDQFIEYCRTRDSSLVEQPVPPNLLSIVHLQDRWASMLDFLEESEKIPMMQWIKNLSNDVALSRTGQRPVGQRSGSILNELEAKTGEQLSMKIEKIRLNEARSSYAFIVSFVWDPLFHEFLANGNLDGMSDKDIAELKSLAKQFDAEILDDFVLKESPYVIEGGLNLEELILLKTNCANLRRLLQASDIGV